MLGARRRRPRRRLDRLDVALGGQLPRRAVDPRRPAERDDDADRHRRRRADRRATRSATWTATTRSAASSPTCRCSSSRCCCWSRARTCCCCSAAGAWSASSSYLLIGFDQHRPAAIAAAKKAFVMNAVGDATMALALFLLIQRTGTLDYGQVFANAPGGTRGDADRARPARRRRREVGAAAAADLAARRDGGPDAGQRADPRGDDGDRRRLPDRPHAPALRAGDRGRAHRRRSSAASRSSSPA